MNLFKNRIFKKSLSTKNINNSLKDKGYNQFDLAAYYITGFKGLGKPINSDLRSNDKNGSLHTKVGKYGDILVSDFGLKIGMTIFEYIAIKYFGESKLDYIKGLDKIRIDYNLTDLVTASFNSNRTIKNIIPKQHKIEISTNSLSTKIEVKRARINGKINWKKQDIKYWNQFGITTKKLEEKGIMPLDAFWITNYNKGGNRNKFDITNELCYVYPFFRDDYGHFMYKIYLPLGYKGNLNFKWISNVNKSVVQNFEFIKQKGDLLIIQSSYKDICCIEILNPKLNIIAPNGEGIWFNNEVWQQLQKNWKNIILFANNDFEKDNNPGLTFARNHSLKYNIPFICTPDNTASDISDYYKLYGEEKTKLFLKDSLNNINTLIN